MTSGNKCKVKDELVNQLIALNDKLNTLSPALLHSEQARAEVQERRESLTSKLSGTGQKDTKANLVLPPSGCPTVQISSNIVHTLGNLSTSNWFPHSENPNSAKSLTHR
jgi:hypothetical protein